MPFPARRASIRARLILLVLALWLPAVAGLGLQAVDAYEREAGAALDELRQQATSLGVAIEAELDRRQVLARALAALPSLRAGDLAAFDREARLAVRGTEQSVMLVDRRQQYLYTVQPAPVQVPRQPGSLFVEEGVGISFVPRGPLTGRPAIAVLVPEAGVAPPRYNVGIPIAPAQVQEVIRRQPVREGVLASIVDAELRVMGRNRDAERWIGRPASHQALRELLASGEGGHVRTTTLDGVASLTYAAPRGRYGWAAVVAMPESTLKASARRLAARAVGVSALLLALALVLALLASRRISQPVRALEEAAGRLLAREVPEPLYTGVAEIDRVGAVLRDASVRARESEQLLESRVEQAVREARDAESRLFEARKHEALGRLTGGVAHDFNNLLQTISTGIQLVQRAVPEGRHSRPLQAALDACSRAASLVRQMLAFGRAQPLRPQPVDLPDLLLRSRELTGKALGERIQLVADLEPTLPAVLADPTQLELALLNLVFNARDAMPAGGTVTVRARHVEGASEHLPDGAFVRVDVQDTGHGMDAETMARVFEPYFTTKPVGAGSGLGLPQVQAFARQSGGEVRIASTPGQGTTVTVLLPASAQAAEQGASQERPAHRPARALRILMVEDDVLVASVVPPALEHEGHHVTVCRTADEARGLLAQGQQADVLFTDVVMPGSMTGLDLVAWCAENRPELPALVATGYSSAPPHGAWKLLRKPYTVEDLLEALDAAVVAPAGAPQDF